MTHCGVFTLSPHKHRNAFVLAIVRLTFDGRAYMCIYRACSMIYMCEDNHGGLCIVAAHDGVTEESAFSLQVFSLQVQNT